MSKKFGLLSELEESKKKYQLFEASMGFENAEILIPFDQADLFLAEALEQKPKSKSVLHKIASKFGGTVR